MMNLTILIKLWPFDALMRSLSAHFRSHRKPRKSPAVSQRFSFFVHIANEDGLC